MSVSRMILAALILPLSACTWVKMEPEGNAVRIAGEAEDLGYCTRAGEIGVEVKDKVGFYRRDDIKVRDELEVMARNEAPRLRADTLRAMDEPLNGAQRFEAFRCRAGDAPAQPIAPAGNTPTGEDSAETFPIP